MKLTNDQLELLTNIQKHLVRGDIAQIAAITGKSPVYVSMVLNPNTKEYNETIVAEATNITSQRKQNTKDLLSQLAD